MVDQLREQLIVEDPTRPLPADAEVTGSARIATEIPERLVVETEAQSPSYLVVSDSFDPGWSATVDGQAATIHPGLLRVPGCLSSRREALRRVRVQPGRLQAWALDQRLRHSTGTLALVLSAAISALGDEHTFNRLAGTLQSILLRRAASRSCWFRFPESRKAGELTNQPAGTRVFTGLPGERG